MLRAMLKNKIIFITGASSGIGMASAKQFAKAGAKLILCARRLDVLDELARQLTHEHGVEIRTLKLDISQSHDVEKAWQTLPDEWKKIDILVNNAGLALGLETLQEGQIQDWE